MQSPEEKKISDLKNKARQTDHQMQNNIDAAEEFDQDRVARAWRQAQAVLRQKFETILPEPCSSVVTKKDLIDELE